MACNREEKTKVIKELSEKISKQLGELGKLDEEKLKEKNRDVKEMISYYTDLTYKTEDRRIRIHNFSLQILAVSVAAAALLFTSNKINISGYTAGVVFYAALAIFFILIVSSLVTSLFFVRQSSFRYAWKDLEKIGQNKWKWFYYGNMNILKINVNPIWQTKNVNNTTIPYLESLKDFVTSYKDEDLYKEISDNIQQLYLLQIHNYYKNRFYSQLTKIWKWSFRLVLIAIIISFLLLLLPIC
jgi:ABC-type multidrug transport system fused ATPase/permease subunit